MSIFNCKTCGRVYFKTGSDYCPECFELIQDKKQLILEYVAIRQDVEFEELCQQFAMDRTEMFKLLASESENVPKPLLKFSCTMCERTMVTDYASRNRHLCTDCIEVLMEKALSKKQSLHAALYAKCKLCSRDFIRRHSQLCHACQNQSNEMVKHLLKFPDAELSDIARAWDTSIFKLQVMLVYGDSDFIPETLTLHCTFCRNSMTSDNRSGLICLSCRNAAQTRFSGLEPSSNNTDGPGARPIRSPEFGLHRKR